MAQHKDINPVAVLIRQPAKKLYAHRSATCRLMSYLALLTLGQLAFASPPPPSQKGIALGLFSSDAQHRYEPYLDEIVAQGANHVSLVTVWYQEDIRAEVLKPRRGYTVPDGILRRTIDSAQQRGLKVLIFPIVGINVRKTNEWRGRIKPKSWDNWFASYTAYILHIAKIAQEKRVETLSVGSELLSTEKMQDRWSTLIAKVRAVYSGRLLYSANWDHFEPVTFWDKVDVAGVTGYYELTKKKDPSLPELIESWGRWSKPLIAHSRRIKKPLVFTEIGYPALDGTNIYPWDETRKEKLDAEEQALCYQAFVEVWGGSPVLDGVFFWNWFGPGGPHDKDYTPRGKPAARVIQKWYASPKQK